MTKAFKTMKTEIRLPYELAYGETWTRFFEGMEDKIIYGTKCSKCGRVLVPARSFCPRCFVNTDDWVELPQEGTLIAWCYVNYKYFGMPFEPPYVVAMIKLDETDANFLHMIGGLDLSDFDFVRKTVKTNMRVKAVWNEERSGNTMDIKYFEPI